MAKTTAEALREHGIDIGRATIHMIDVKALTVVSDPAHPLYDPRVHEPIEKLRETGTYASILEEGVRDAIGVRRNGLDENDRPILEVAWGRQRTRMLLDINARIERGELQGEVRRISCIFVHGSIQQIVLLGLAENCQRLEETPWSKSVKMHNAKRAGATIVEIARACNTTPAHVEEHLTLQGFAPEVQQAFNGELPATTIAVFANVPQEKQAAALAEVRASGAKGTRQIAGAVKAARKGEHYKPPETRPQMWRRTKIEALSARLDKLAMTGATGSAGASAMVRFLLGDSEALKSFPALHALVSGLDGPGPENVSEVLGDDQPQRKAG